MTNSSRVLIEAMAADSRVLKLALQQARAYWAPDEPPVTTVLGGFAACLLDDSTDPTAPATQRALLVVEDAMKSGDTDLVMVAATGFVEGLTAAASRHGVLPQFLAALGPRSRSHAQAWLKFAG